MFSWRSIRNDPMAVHIAKTIKHKRFIVRLQRIRVVNRRSISERLKNKDLTVVAFSSAFSLAFSLAVSWRLTGV